MSLLLLIHVLYCLVSQGNLNSTFSTSCIQMAITFDVLLDRFQENKVFQTAQTMKNFLGQIQNDRFVTMEAMTF